MNVRVENVLGEDAVADFLNATPIMKGLPAGAYTDEAFFKLEQKKVFQANWSLAGFAHEIPQPGDAIPGELGGLPIVMVRGKEGQIRVFHNVCRHRGLKLVDEPCSGRKDITCPYHGWMYGLDGRLLVAPHFGGMGKRTTDGFDYDERGLVEVRSAVWHDWIFANLDGNAGDFDEFLDPLKRYVGDLDLSRLDPILQMDSGTVDANWKFLTENFAEPYHVPMIHPETAAGQPLKDHYMIRDRNLVGCGIDVGDTANGAKAPKPGNGKELCLDFSAWYLVLYPHFNFFVYFGDEKHVYVMLNTPLAPDRTHQRRVIYQLGGPDQTDESREAWRKLNEDVIREDWEMAVRLQAGRASPVMADGGVMSPAWEVGEHGFDELIMASMRA